MCKGARNCSWTAGGGLVWGARLRDRGMGRERSGGGMGRERHSELGGDGERAT